MNPPIYSAKIVNTRTPVSGQLIVCNGTVNTGKYYICTEVTEISTSDEGVVAQLGSFVEVDPKTVKKILN